MEVYGMSVVQYLLEEDYGMSVVQYLLEEDYGMSVVQTLMELTGLSMSVVPEQFIKGMYIYFSLLLTFS